MVFHVRKNKKVCSIRLILFLFVSIKEESSVDKGEMFSVIKMFGNISSRLWHCVLDDSNLLCMCENVTIFAKINYCLYLIFCIGDNT